MFGRPYIDFARWGFQVFGKQRNIDMQNAIDTCHSKNSLLSESMHGFNQDKPTCQIIAVSDQMELESLRRLSSHISAQARGSVRNYVLRAAAFPDLFKVPAVI